jgi:membrane protein required for colicin V production
MLMQFNWLDFCFIGLITFSALIGFIRGLVQELSSIANLALSLWSGIIFYESIGERLPDIIQPAEVRYVIGFFIGFAAVLIAVTLLSKTVSWFVNSIGLKGPDRILGVLFGILRGVLCTALVILVKQSSSFSGSDVWRSSILIPYFEPLKQWLAELIPYDFK